MTKHSVVKKLNNTIPWNDIIHGKSVNENNFYSKLHYFAVHENEDVFNNTLKYFK